MEVGSSHSKTAVLSSRLVSSITIGKVFEDNLAKINALDFYKDGDLVITSSDDSSLNLYSTVTAKKQKVVFCKTFGVDLVRFTHHSSAVLCASKNEFVDESLRYLSLHDNRYLRYFKGHRDRVVSLCMSPKDDMFISGSLDNTIRLWDLNTSTCQGVLRRKGRPTVSFDPQGVIFAVATGTNMVKLYDLRSYDKGPFSSFLVNYAPIEWSSMKFSNNGKYILLSTTTNVIFLLDAFSGDQIQVYSNFSNSLNCPIEASFSPDGQFVIAGSDDGFVHVWETASGKKIGTWKGHTGPVTAILWNPKRAMIASGGNQLLFWIPGSTENTAISY